MVAVTVGEKETMGIAETAGDGHPHGAGADDDSQRLSGSAAHLIITVPFGRL
jgi:hypothetical protein